MSRWFRHYAGMMRDDKLVRVAIRAKQPVERVVWVWGAILESAAEIDDNGRFDVDAAEVAYFLRADQADIDAIMDGLADLQRINSGAVVNWGDRQFSSDKSKERVAAYRERQRAKSGGNQRKSDTQDVTVTACNDDVTAQETETDISEPKGSLLSKRAIPDDWQPSSFGLGTESRKVVDSWPPGELAAQVEQFKAHHRAKGNKFKDFQDAFSTWVLNTRKFGVGRNERQPGKSASHTADAYRLLNGDSA